MQAALRVIMSNNNYEIMRDQMRPCFLAYDQEEMIRKFSLENDPKYLYISFCGRRYRIGRSTGIVEWSEDDFQTCTMGDYEESMTIYDVLCYSKKGCCLSGEFAPSSSLKGVILTRMRAGGVADHRITRYFDGNIELLERACVALGGVPEGKGDLAYRIPIFDFLPMRFSFWRSDEEFPAEVQMLWDTNILSFMHFETIWYAAGHMLRRIEEYMQMHGK